MNPFVPAGKGIDMENLPRTGAFQVPNQIPLPILSKNDDQVKGFKEPGELGVEGALSNKKGGHPLLIDREDFLAIETVLDQFEDPRIAHKNGSNTGERPSENIERRQARIKSPKAP